MNIKIDQNKKVICRRCGLLLDDGWHCSEAMIDAGWGGCFSVCIRGLQGLRLARPRRSCRRAQRGSHGLFAAQWPHGRQNDDRNQVLCVESVPPLPGRVRLREKCLELKANWIGEFRSGEVQLVEKAAGILLDVLGE